MDIDRLTQIIDWMATRPLREMELTGGEFSLRLVRAEAGVAVVAPVALPVAPAPQVAAVTAATLDAPMFGILHLSPAPGAAPFVQPGQAVTAGQTLCVIEAMKVFNTVTADRPGTVAALLAADGEEVAAGQPLIRFAAETADV